MLIYESMHNERSFSPLVANIVLPAQASDSSLSLPPYALCFICMRRNDGEKARNVNGRGNALCYIRVIRYDNVTYINVRRSR